MKIDPSIIHDAVNKWVEGKPQPADKVGEERYPFLGLRGRDDLPYGRKPMRDVLGQVSDLP